MDIGVLIMRHETSHLGKPIHLEKQNALDWSSIKDQYNCIVITKEIDLFLNTREAQMQIIGVMNIKEKRLCTLYMIYTVREENTQWNFCFASMNAQ